MSLGPRRSPSRRWFWPSAVGARGESFRSSSGRGGGRVRPATPAVAVCRCASGRFFCGVQVRDAESAPGGAAGEDGARVRTAFPVCRGPRPGTARPSPDGVSRGPFPARRFRWLCAKWVRATIRRVFWWCGSTRWCLRTMPGWISQGQRWPNGSHRPGCPGGRGTCFRASRRGQGGVARDERAMAVSRCRRRPVGMPR
jgi:hypothetical protein